MPGLSPKLPLTTDVVDGLYKLNKTYFDLIEQNLKHLILTNPGERVMDPDFGVGIKRFLFEQNDQIVKGQIDGAIRTQVQKYMSFLTITRINFFDSTHPTDVASNLLNIEINYYVAALDISNNLELTIGEN